MPFKRPEPLAGPRFSREAINAIRRKIFDLLAKQASFAPRTAHPGFPGTAAPQDSPALQRGPAAAVDLVADGSQQTTDGRYASPRRRQTHRRPGGSPAAYCRGKNGEAGGFVVPRPTEPIDLNQLEKLTLIQIRSGACAGVENAFQRIECVKQRPTGVIVFVREVKIGNPG
jgi:hypothetical protein